MVMMVSGFEVSVIWDWLIAGEAGDVWVRVVEDEASVAVGVEDIIGVEVEVVADGGLDDLVVIGDGDGGWALVVGEVGSAVGAVVGVDGEGVGHDDLWVVRCWYSC